MTITFTNVHNIYLKVIKRPKNIGVTRLYCICISFKTFKVLWSSKWKVSLFCVKKLCDVIVGVRLSFAGMKETRPQINKIWNRILIINFGCFKMIIWVQNSYQNSNHFFQVVCFFFLSLFVYRLKDYSNTLNRTIATVWWTTAITSWKTCILNNRTDTEHSH